MIAPPTLMMLNWPYINTYSRDIVFYLYFFDLIVRRYRGAPRYALAHGYFATAQYAVLLKNMNKTQIEIITTNRMT